jgi:A/G-specific adenine glycosylase
MAYYSAHGRHDLPWRTNFDPYSVTVSELMLQQTQVPRVVPKFLQFTERFSDWRTLAQASLSDVLSLWQGLGYNRRAKYLHEMSKVFAASQFPVDIQDLKQHKGIGHNTAAAILTYSYNQRYVFIETNIRTVLIHHFYSDLEMVTDSQLEETLEWLLKLTVDYRHFYWALMDYGTYLKREQGNNIAKSAHYKKQPQFQGSMRQLRAQLLRLLLIAPQRVQSLLEELNDVRVPAAVASLQREKMIQIVDDVIHIAEE